MKKILFVICLFFTTIFTCANEKCITEKEKTDRGVFVTFKNGFFYPQECKLRNIFDRCGSKGGYWPELAVRYNFWKEMNVEASGSFFRKKGKALCGPECAEVTMPTLGLGLKYFFPSSGSGQVCSSSSSVLFFLGAGLRVFFYREKNDSPFVLSCVKKTTAGGMVNAGFEFMVWKDLFVDLFADYNFKKMHLDCDDVCLQSNNLLGCCKPSYFCKLNLGGVVAGIGLGYKF